VAAVHIGTGYGVNFVISFSVLCRGCSRKQGCLLVYRPYRDS